MYIMELKQHFGSTLRGEINGKAVRAASCSLGSWTRAASVGSLLCFSISVCSRPGAWCQWLGITLPTHNKGDKNLERKSIMSSLLTLFQVLKH